MTGDQRSEIVEPTRPLHSTDMVGVMARASWAHSCAADLGGLHAPDRNDAQWQELVRDEMRFILLALNAAGFEVVAKAGSTNGAER